MSYADCEGLEDPAYGTVSYAGTTFEYEATYSCSSGYVLVGDQTRTCKSDHYWSGSQPSCVPVGELVLISSRYRVFGVFFFFFFFFRPKIVDIFRISPRKHMWLFIRSASINEYQQYIMTNAQKDPYVMCGQRRPRSACAKAQADQGLHCPLSESKDIVVYVGLSGLRFLK